MASMTFGVGKLLFFIPIRLLILARRSAKTQRFFLSYGSVDDVWDGPTASFFFFYSSSARKLAEKQKHLLCNVA